MAKQTTSVYADIEKLKRAEELGYSPSVLLSMMVDAILDGEFDDSVVNARLGMLDDTIKNQKLKLAELSIQMTNIEESLSRLIDQRDQLELEWQHARTRTVLRSKMRLLNVKLIKYNFDPQLLLDSEDKIVLDEIMSINPTFDFVKHAKRLQKIL